MDVSSNPQEVVQSEEVARSVLLLEDLADVIQESPEQLLTHIDPQFVVQLTGKRKGVLSVYVRSLLEERGVSYDPQVIAHSNLRGGIGKTTATITTAERAAQYGFRTCVLDMDSQGSASLAFDCLPGPEDPIFYDIWQNPDDLLGDAIVDVSDMLSILPSGLENCLLESALRNPASQKIAVASVCRALHSQGFDLVFIDCPPSLGAAVVSSFCAANKIVIPVGTDEFSFRGLEMTIAEVRSICEVFGLTEPDMHVFISRYDRREKASDEAQHRLRDTYGTMLLPVVIGTSTAIPRAVRRRKTVFGSLARNSARDDYDAYTRELLRIAMPAQLSISERPLL